MTFRVRVEIEDFDNDGTASVERTINTERWPDLIDVFLDALRGVGFTIADSDVEISRPRDAEIEDFCAERESEYPLCEKYKAPLVDGCLRSEDYRAWVATLPPDWPARFGEVMGPVTCSPAGTWACDVEDTLWALEMGYSHRRWNG